MSSQPQENWAWLGLLKWSLTYVDGTVPSEESPNFRQMSEEDKKFLEEVMKNGIIDEGERMKTILNNLVKYLDSIKGNFEGNSENELSADSGEPSGVSTTEEIETLLQELQDIVEQIDYARSFAAMGGIPFLIGCASQTKAVPQSIRAASLSTLGTLNQNNPAVQYSMLEQGNIPKLVNIYFEEYLRDDECSTTTPVHAAALQAMSCSVRNHDVAEQIFCMNPDARKMIESALGMYSHSQTSMTVNYETQTHSSANPSTQGQLDSTMQTLPPPTDALQRKALFFLQALITSDSSDASRVRLFDRAIQYVSGWFVDPDVQKCADMRETTLSMLTRILDQKKSVNAILDVKSYLVDLGVRRIHEIRALQEDEERERMREELELWELLMSQLACAVRDEWNPDREAALALPMNQSTVGDTLPQ